MVKYGCDKCGHEFKQKSHYDRHINKKRECISSNKLEEIINKVVEKKVKELDLKKNDESDDSDSLDDEDRLNEDDFMDYSDIESDDEETYDKPEDKKKDDEDKII